MLPKDAEYKQKMEEYKKEGVKVTMESKDLQGDSRVVVEGLLTQQQCDDFVELAKVCVSLMYMRVTIHHPIGSINFFRCLKYFLIRLYMSWHRIKSTMELGVWTIWLPGSSFHNFRLP